MALGDNRKDRTARDPTSASRYVISDPHPASLRSATLPLRGRDKRARIDKTRRAAEAVSVRSHRSLSARSIPPRRGGWPPKRSVAKRRRPGGGCPEFAKCGAPRAFYT